MKSKSPIRLSHVRPSNANHVTYDYDANGSQTLKSTAAGDTVYKWDLRGRMVGIDTNDDGTADVTYTYDSDGVRVSESADGQTTYYLNDKQNPTGYAKAIEDRTDTNADGSADVARTSYILGTQVIGQASASGTYFMLLDGHGSTAALTNTSGTLVEEYAYSAFGEAIGFDASTAKTNWLFGGDGIWDAKSQMTYHLARWRDGHRFVSYDSFEADPSSPAALHRFLYAETNPVQGWDPSGHSFVGLLMSTLNMTRQLAGVGFMASGVWNLSNGVAKATEGITYLVGGILGVEPRFSLYRYIGTMLLSAYYTYTGMANLDMGMFLYTGRLPASTLSSMLPVLRSAFSASGGSATLMASKVIALNPAVAIAIVNTAGLTNSVSALSNFFRSYQKPHVDSAGNTQIRDIIEKPQNGNGDEELLEYAYHQAKKLSGRDLSEWTYNGKRWISPDGRYKLEWETVGHRTTAEGPHVAIEENVGGAWQRVRTAFIEGREQYGWQ